MSDIVFTFERTWWQVLGTRDGGGGGGGGGTGVGTSECDLAVKLQLRFIYRRLLRHTYDYLNTGIGNISVHVVHGTTQLQSEE